MENNNSTVSFIEIKRWFSEKLENFTKEKGEKKRMGKCTEKFFSILSC